MAYTLKFFDDTGEVTLTVKEYATIESALNAAMVLGADEFSWDTFMLSSSQRLCFQGLFGTFGIVDQEYFDGRFA